MSWAKKIKRNQLNRLTERKPSRLERCRKKAEQVEWETTQQALLATDDMVKAVQSFSAVYTIYILFDIFHLRPSQVERFKDKLQSINGCVRDGIIEFDDIVADAIRAKDNFGCKYPDYIPSYTEDVFAPKRVLMLNKLREAGKSLKQAMVTVKRFEYMEMIYSQLEILILISLHDALGFSRKRLERYITAFRHLRHGTVTELRAMMDMLERKKCDFSSLRVDWQLLKEMEALQCV